MENGKIVLIGATTSNPYHAINPAIRSRAQIFELYPLDDNDIRLALNRALEDDQRGLKSYTPEVDDDAMTYFSTQSQGDVRSALNALELAVLSATEEDGQRHITLQDAKDCLQKALSLAIKMEICTMM